MSEVYPVCSLSGAHNAKHVMLLKDGTLSYEEFCFFSKLFASVALKNNDTWIIHGSEDYIGSMYLVKKIAPNELHMPHLCLHGLSFHQQHWKPSHLQAIQGIIRSCMYLLNNRVGALPEKSISMMELHRSQVDPNKILWCRHSLNFPKINESFQIDPPGPFSLHTAQCGSHALQSKAKYDQEIFVSLRSKFANPSDSVNSFSANMLPTNALSQDMTSDIVSDRVGPNNIIRPPTQFCNTVKLLENEPDVNCILNDDIFCLQEAGPSLCTIDEKVDDFLFESEFYSGTVPLSTEENIYSSVDPSDDFSFSDTGKVSSEKPTNGPYLSSLLHCDSFSCEDPAALNVPDTREKDLFWEFHVVYSVSYCVPVLFFQVWDSDGKIVPLHELWRIVDIKFQGRLRHDKWSILTQQEHPLLRRPFYFLHPCGTESLLKILKPSWNPIVSWLMTIGPSIGLNICPLYGMNQELKDT